MPKLVSSIKPEKIKSSIEWNNRTAQSYVEAGFEVPKEIDFREKRFLSRLDTKNPKFDRVVTRIIRLKAPDYSDPKKRRKEFIIYYENWIANDFKGQKMPSVPDHMEGMYYEQESAPEYDGANVTGYVRSGQHPVYYIPFSKEAVDKIIEKSIGTDEENINFTFKANESMRDNTFTYEQFILPWDEALRLASQVGGARAPPPRPAVHEAPRIRTKE